jgi:hypothetical protein
MRDGEQLILSCGKSAFKLSPSTPFYTLDGHLDTYLFAVESLAESYVKIVLPDLKQQDAFEQIFIDRGLLKEGLAAAAGDELGSAAVEGSVAASASLKDAVDSHTSGPAKEGWSAPEALKSATASASSATQTAGEYTHKAAEALGSLAEAAGAGAASYIRQGAAATGLFEGEKSEARKTAESVVDGVASAGSGAGQGLVHRLDCHCRAKRRSGSPTYTVHPKTGRTKSSSTMRGRKCSKWLPIPGIRSRTSVAWRATPS